jgi:hypothetical protein
MTISKKNVAAQHNSSAKFLRESKHEMIQSSRSKRAHIGNLCDIASDCCGDPARACHRRNRFLGGGQIDITADHSATKRRSLLRHQATEAAARSGDDDGLLIDMIGHERLPKNSDGLLLNGIVSRDKMLKLNTSPVDKQVNPVDEARLFRREKKDGARNFF